MIINVLPQAVMEAAGKFALILFDKGAEEGVKLVVEGLTADEVRESLNERRFSVSQINLNDKTETQSIA